MKKDDIILTIVITLAFGLVALFVILAALTFKADNAEGYYMFAIYIIIAILIIAFLVHWLSTGHRGFFEWFTDKKGCIICSWAFYSLSIPVSVLLGNIFYMALFIIPLVGINGFMLYYMEKRKQSIYFNGIDFEEIAEYITRYKCCKCDSDISKVLYKNYKGKKKIGYRCNSCFAIYEKRDLKNKNQS